MTTLDLLQSLVGLVGAALVAWTALRAPSWAVALVVASVPLQAYAHVGPATWTQAWLWTFLAVGAALVASGRATVTVDALAVAFGLLVAAYAVSRLNAGDEGLWRNETYRWAAALAFLVVARSLLAGHRATVPLTLATAAGAVWTTAVAVVQVVADVGPESFERAGLPRAYATFGEPNTYGAFAGLSALALAASALLGHARLPASVRLAASLGSAAGAVGLVLSQSRGALLAFAVTAGLGVLLVVDARLGRRSPFRVAAAAAVILATLAVAPTVADALSPPDPAVEVTPATWADGERAAHWGAALRMVVDSRGLGVGAGQFDLAYRDATPAWRFRIPQGHAHDAYLQVAAEAGLAALGVYLVVLASAALALLRAARRPAARPAAVAALAVTLAFAVHNLVDYLHVLNLPLVLVAWWAAALSRDEGPLPTP